MGWAAHKKWLLIFLSKFCLRLCGDFCLLFSACSHPFGLSHCPSTPDSSSLTLCDSLNKYTHVPVCVCVCTSTSPGHNIQASSFFLLQLLLDSIRFSFVCCCFFILFQSFFLYFFVRFAFVVSSSCCCHRWWFSIQFIFGSLLLLLPFLFHGSIAVCARFFLPISLCASVHFFYFCIYFFVMIFPFFRCCCCCYCCARVFFILFWQKCRRVERINGTNGRTSKRDREIGMSWAVRDESIIKRW